MTNRTAWTASTVILALEVAITIRGYQMALPTWKVLALGISLGVCLGIWILLGLKCALDD